MIIAGICDTICNHIRIPAFVFSWKMLRNPAEREKIIDRKYSDNRKISEKYQKFGFTKNLYLLNCVIIDSNNK